MPRKQKPSHEVPLSREVTNSDRAIWARIALEAFQADTGTDRDSSDFEYDSDTAKTYCSECNNSGVHQDFVIEGLDDDITRRNNRRERGEA